MKRILKILLPLTGRAGFAKYILLGIISGLCSFLFINLVTRSIGLLMNDSLKFVTQEYIILFLSVILAFIWSRRVLSYAIIQLSQRLFWNLRKQILSLILNSGYADVFGKKARIHSAIVNDVNILTQASISIIDFFTSVVLALSCLLYLLYISGVLFLIVLAVALAGVFIYHFTSKKNSLSFQQAHVHEDNFIEHFNSILNGFKEIFMEPRIGKYIYHTKIDPISKAAYRNNVSAFSGYLNNQITGQVLFYLMISSILLFFGRQLQIKTQDIISFVFTLLYLLGAIEAIMVLMPALSRASVASDHLMDLKAELEQVTVIQNEETRYTPKSEFEKIVIRDLEFSHEKTGQPFSIGPIDLTVEKGQIIFIYGGNGSGKTTFVHCLLGLFMPLKGEIRFNHTLVEKSDYPSYRALFSVVFSDFFLFNEIFMVSTDNMDKWFYYIQLFELEGKVELDGNCFSTISLSTGQRKRLALISALLEEKPVLVIDEWAADQDPYFRKKFYTVILPLLKKEGFTILAITHDDTYYHCCDRLFKMEDGTLISEAAAIFPQGLSV